MTDRLPIVSVPDPGAWEQFLDFWRVPAANERLFDATARLLVAGSFAERPRNAVVAMPGTGAPKVYRISDGSVIHAAVRPIDGPPEGMSVAWDVTDDRGRRVSAILFDESANSYYLPFSPDEAFSGFYLERYAGGRTFPPEALLNLYYAAKPLLPKALLSGGRKILAPMQSRSSFPEWPVEIGFERLKRLLLSMLVRVSRSDEIPFVWFWPEEYDGCLVLTHDVERSLAGNDGIWRLLSAEKRWGFRSGYNVVPFKYEVDDGELDRLRGEGCEIGVHGYSHDGTLFRDKQKFAERARQINEVAAKWGATGFRGAATYRDPQLLQQLDFDYDLSFFDTDPFEPQPGGCLSLFPYFIGDIVEIPMTVPQDHTLLTVTGRGDLQRWTEKMSVIAGVSGMVCLNAHPDDGYLGDEAHAARYDEFLGSIADNESLWNPLPGELARWWRARRAATIVGEGGDFEVLHGSPGMCVKRARVSTGELEFVTAKEALTL